MVKISPQQAMDYLQDRALEVSQSTLDMERQALTMMFRHVTHQLDPEHSLERVFVPAPEELEARAYTQEQVSLILERQTDRNALATEIAHAAGLRAHELLTLNHPTIQPADFRDKQPEARELKFEGREGVVYTVVGKGGLVREVMLPMDLAQRLEESRLSEPVTVYDRRIEYQCHYDVGGGRSWSQSFSSASERALGWSSGAHGLRHSYAQERMEELQSAGYTREISLAIVSQEMGHFRPDITEVYLR